jgi:hypothetical protein
MTCIGLETVPPRSTIIMVILMVFLLPTGQQSISSDIQDDQKDTKPMEKCDINFIFFIIIISAENVHHYALHRDVHDESC